MGDEERADSQTRKAGKQLHSASSPSHNMSSHTHTTGCQADRKMEGDTERLRGSDGGWSVECLPPCEPSKSTCERGLEVSAKRVKVRGAWSKVMAEVCELAEVAVCVCSLVYFKSAVSAVLVSHCFTLHV